MPTCRKCQASFPNKAIIAGKWRTLNSRSYCLDCSPWGTHNTTALHLPPKAGLVEVLRETEHVADRLALVSKPKEDRSTCDIGDISEAFVRALMLQAGYSIMTSDRAGSPYDHILEQPGRFLRVQTKTGRLRDGCVLFMATRSRGPKDKNPGTRVGYTADEVDVFAVFCEELMTVYLVPLEDIPKAGMCVLRVLPVRGGQKECIRWAKDYEICSA